MLQVHAMHVTCRATACAQVPGCRRGQAERRSPECAVTALCARSSNELTKKSAGGTKPDPPGLQSQGCLSDGDRCGGVCCMFCVCTSRDFILPLIYVYIPHQSCFIKGRNQNMGSSGTVGPRLVEVHIRPCAGDDGAHFDDDRKGKRDRRPQEGCWRAQSQACKRKLVIESAKPRCWERHKADVLHTGKSCFGPTRAASGAIIENEMYMLLNEHALAINIYIYNVFMHAIWYVKTNDTWYIK